MTPTPPKQRAPSLPADRAVTHRDLSMLSWAAIIIAAIALLAVMSELVPTVIALVTPGPKSAEEAEQDQERRTTQFNERLTRSLALAQGRSMFVVPPAPGDEEKTETVAEQETDGPAPKPTRYTGPDPIAVINNAVWFADSTVVPLGKERQGIRVVSVDRAPWSVRLEWRDVEFDVPIFENTTQSFLQKSKPSARP